MPLSTRYRTAHLEAIIGLVHTSLLSIGLSGHTGVYLPAARAHQQRLSNKAFYTPERSQERFTDNPPSLSDPHKPLINSTLLKQAGKASLRTIYLLWFCLMLTNSRSLVSLYS